MSYLTSFEAANQWQHLEFVAQRAHFCLVFVLFSIYQAIHGHAIVTSLLSLLELT